MTDGRDRSFAELAGRLCNWDRWSREDGLGTLNLVTPEKRLEASAAIRSGVAISLGFELRDRVPQPPSSGRMNPMHLMTELPGDAPADGTGRSSPTTC